MMRRLPYVDSWKLGNPRHTLLLFNIAMENGPFTDDFPSYKHPFNPLSLILQSPQMVNTVIYIYY